MELPPPTNSLERAQKISERRFTVLVCVAIAVAVIGIYWQITSHEFVNFDTAIYLTDNLEVKRGLTWEGVKWAFTTVKFGQWYPLTWLSLMLDCELYGLNPGGYHLHNLLFHALNSVLLFLALCALTRSQKGYCPGAERESKNPRLQSAGNVDLNLWACALATALFALHPLRVESVAWIVERKDMLSGLFWWLTLLLYGRYVASPGPARYLALLTAFVLGLMSKPMQITLPFTLILLDYWPLRRVTWENFRRDNRKPLWSVIIEKVPIFFIAVGFAAFTYISSLGMLTNDCVPLSIRLGNAALSYLRYLGKMFWPVNLACLYPIQLALPWWKVWVAALILLSITALALWRARATPYFITGWLWFLGTLVPVIGIIQVGPQAMADRYSYISCIGINIIVAWSLVAAMRRRRWLKAVIVPVIVLALVALTARSFSQAALWRDSISLYRHTLSVTSDNPVVHNNLGVALQARGDLENAAYEYEEALRIFPEYPHALNNLGTVYVDLEQDREAVSHFSRAIRCRPNYICLDFSYEPYINLGEAYERLGKYPEAISVYRQLLERSPRWNNHFRLAMVYTCIFEYEKAIEELRQAVALNPDYPDAHYYLVINYLRLGNTGAAMEYHRKLFALDPKMAEELSLSGGSVLLRQDH